MRRTIRWCAWTAAGLIGLVLVIGLALVVLGADALRPTIARTLSNALERQVAIEGRLNLGWNGGPALAAEGVTIAGDPGRPPLVEADRLVVRLDAGALLGGDVVLSRIGLRDVIVRPDSLGEADAPAQGSVPAETTSPADLSMLAGDFTVNLGGLTIESGSGGLPLTVPSLTLQTASGGITRLEGELAYRDATITLTATGAGLETLLAGQSWPVEITLAQAGNTASASGVFKNLTTVPSANLTLHGEGGDLDSLLAPLGLESGIEDAFAFSAHVEADLDRIAASELQFTVGTFEVLGDLSADLAASPLAVSGRLDLTSLPQGHGDGTVVDGELLSIAVPYDLLDSMDLDVALTIARHELGGLVLSEIEIPLHLASGELVVAPLIALIDGERMEASLRVSARSNSIAATLHADRVPLANLLRHWRPDLALFGEAGDGIDLDGKASGATLRDLLASLKLELEARSIQLSARWLDGSASRAELNRLTVSAGSGRYLMAQADGTIDGNPASLFVTTGELRELVAGTDGWPLELHLGNEDVGVDLAGVIMHPDTASGLRVEGLLRAKSFAPINGLLDIDIPVDGRIESYFHVSDIDGGMRLDWIDATVGESSLQGTLDIVDAPSEVSVTGSLAGPRLVLALGGGNTETDIDALILEQGDLDGVSLDIALDVDRLVIAPVVFDAITTRLLLDKGVLSLTDGKTTVMGSHADIAIALDASQARPALSASLIATEVDPHDIGSNMGLQNLLTGHIDRIALELDSHGTTLREYAEAATAQLGLDGGTLHIGKDAKGLDFQRLELNAAPDTPISGTEEIVLGGIPITLALSFVPLVDLIATPSPWKLDGRGSLLGLEFEISRSITPSLAIYARPVTMRLKSDDIRTALAEFGVTMPRPLPLTTEGTVQVFSDHVAFELGETRLAGSDLQGTLELSLDAVPQRVTASFVSDIVAVDDFLSQDDSTDATPEEEERSMEERLATSLPAWTMPDLALDLQLNAKEIHWSDNVMEDVGTRIAIADDILRIDDLQAQVFGGSVAGAITLQPLDAQTRLTTRLAISGINSDKLLREAGIAEAASGEVALDLDIDTQGATPGEMLSGLYGKAALKRGSGWIRSGAVAVLTKNILSALLSSLFSPSQETGIRCIVLNVDFEHGIGTLQQSAVALDNVVVVAGGSFDLGKQTIDVQLDPKAVDWSFLRLLTPVYVVGDLLDPKVSPHSGEVLAGLGAALFGAGPIYDGDLDVLCAGT